MHRIAPWAASLACLVSTVALAQTAAPEWVRGELTDFESIGRDDAVPSPAELLGYEVGEHFTRHADMVRAIERIAEASDRVHLERYGLTHQRRPLLLLTISSAQNLARLDEILAANRELADPATSEARAAEIIETNPAVVWFSFGVHGNESSNPEAALRVIETMAAGQGDAVEAILEDVVLALDPSVNPDGHERYVSWYQNTVGRDANADPAATEHSEPWPGGRTNHYLFDLNRDWLWLVQPESRQRLARYREYLPQLHIDHHEQGYTNPYFLGAGDEPYNTNIPRETRDWIEMYGDANAESFDREGRLYSTRERFDYLYPGYGKVLPVYHGAVGMLLEQAGHSRAGLAIEVDEHYTLTLTERSRNHWLIAMSNLEATARHRAGQLERFRRYFVSAVEEGQGEPWACVVSADNPAGLLARLWDLCEAHGIRVDRLGEAIPVPDPDAAGVEAEEGVMIPAGSWVISTDQAMGRLAKALLEPAPVITDRDTYDVTSWSLPATFGLEAYYTTEPLETTGIGTWEVPPGSVSGDGSVALIVDGAAHRFPRAMAIAGRHDLTARIADEPFGLDGEHFAVGSLIVHTLRNQHADLEAFTDEIVDEGLRVHRAGTGLTDEGPVLAANANRGFVAPSVALVRADSISSGSFGSTWHMLDVVWEIPHTVIDGSRLGSANLDERSAVVIPGGSLPESSVSALNSYIRSGGVVVASGSGASWAERQLLGLEEDEEADLGDDESDERPDPSELSYADRRDRGVDDRIPGALLGLSIDRTHPLSAGAPGRMGVIKFGERVLRVEEDGYVIARFAEGDDLVVGGSISDRNADELAGKPFMTAHRRGRGWVVCLAEDVTFRGFEHGPMRLLLNAILYAPGM